MVASMVAQKMQITRPTTQAARCARSSVAAFRAPLQAVPFHQKISVVARAAEEAEAPVTTEEWAAERLARLQAAENVQAEDPAFSLNFLWLDKNIGVAVDQVFAKGQRSPVTEFFFWPRKDAWEELKAALEGKPWIAEREKVLLLNKCTEVINYWQDETKHSLSEAQQKFADCTFSGTA